MLRHPYITDIHASEYMHKCIHSHGVLRHLGMGWDPDVDTETDIDIHSHSLPWYVTEGGFTELRMGGAREGGPEELVGTGALGVKLLLQED